MTASAMGRNASATTGALTERQRTQLLGLLRRVEAHLDQVGEAG